MLAGAGACRTEAATWERAANTQPRTASASSASQNRQPVPAAACLNSIYVFRTSHMIGTGAFTTPDRLVRVAW